ncbi:MAG: four helix bundle suffix domain-containing protein [Patescibacteria group bacterium]
MYKDLKTYQNTVIIHDFTVEFCRRYVDYKSRTKDQMEQAARSGKQNITEGCEASRTSKKTELKLLGVAYASLKELLEDYEDYLRQHNLALWVKDSEPAKAVRALAYTTHKSYMTYKSYMEKPEEACNAMICLISQTTYMLSNQIKSLKEAFLQEGGFTENLYKERSERRGRK